MFHAHKHDTRILEEKETGHQEIARAYRVTPSAVEFPIWQPSWNKVAKFNTLV